MCFSDVIVLEEGPNLSPEDSKHLPSTTVMVITIIIFIVITISVVIVTLGRGILTA